MRIDEQQLYGRLLVLSSLHSLHRNRYYRIQRQPDRDQSSSDAKVNLVESRPQDVKDDDKLRVFLDCLAETCASRRNGGTVTAVTVHRLSNSDHPRFVFVSNNRSKNAAKAHVQDILEEFGCFQDYPGCPQDRRALLIHYNGVLRKILKFNRERFKTYVKIAFSCLETLYTRPNLNKSCKHFLPPITWERSQI